MSPSLAVLVVVFCVLPLCGPFDWVIQMNLNVTSFLERRERGGGREAVSVKLQCMRTWRSSHRQDSSCMIIPNVMFKMLSWLPVQADFLVATRQRCRFRLPASPKSNIVVGMAQTDIQECLPSREFRCSRSPLRGGSNFCRTEWLSTRCQPTQHSGSPSTGKGDRVSRVRSEEFSDRRVTPCNAE